MTVTYLDRYLAGEHEQVWYELVELGQRVRSDAIYEDACAVARETMRRARRNLELLVPRLSQIGYQFGYGWIQPSASRDFGWKTRQEYTEFVEWARTQPLLLSFPDDYDRLVSEYAERLRRLQQLGASPSLINSTRRRLDELQSQPPITRLLDDLEAAVGSLPISVRAWYEIVGSLNLVGYHSGWRAILTGGDREEEAYSRDGETDPISFLEPLYVYPLSAGRVADYVERAAKGGRVQGFRLSLIPNGKRAYGLRGQDAFDYEITLPCDAADAALLGTSSGTTFIGYLRSCFRWGGFPNWGQWSERPERDLEILQQGLLPI